ncbi:Flavin-dependent oxidoreductase, luciferase family (includes alkanesulfonate monooxygenase SsuD and methylene tetrahydromethanopterin reductase) [Streptosporangium canum]|uniref:Flavin-dependent oxidoreductase, luciferase family (Includes alkanesulfonate monooxygenase SsuD and methylene tetrahydromethanopterin reductase) n=1 Tax=Streptosporangium canum TaxID=324952 RepID=A0A1I3RXY1_9ACTN|nr:LLM class flavin-dependent oxidoreductase [Streptosporangium canum]SFJ51474.1 Flavin-dependent oxidoreductase, luciferase family (includes alkanesulfonate monooxygenase SsuD and methylene tetrahydromethanopterin reductase) [Streptosporangium canum]
MRIGVFLVAAGFPGRRPGEVLRDTVEAVAAAEDAGFDDAWIAEHHFMSYGVCPSAVTLAGVALGRTSRIRVGTAVSVLSTRHPVDLAEQAAVLDQVSGGRFTLGVGRGGPWVDLEVFGTGPARFERGFAESLDLLCAALSQETVAADGEFFRFREVPMVPAVRLRPVVACTSPETVTLAAERGLPMLLGMHIGDEEKAAMLRNYRRTAVRPPAAGGPGGREFGGRESRGAGGSMAGPAGPPPPGHVAAVVGHVGDSTAQVVEELREAMPRWLEPGLAGYVPVDGRARPRRDIPAYVDFLCDTHPVGSPGHCVERITRTAEVTGLGHLMLMVEGAGEQARTLENIRRLGAEVLPRVRGRLPSSRRAPASG